MDVETALLQLTVLTESIAQEAEMNRNLPGMQADTERFIANAAYYVLKVLSDASETKDSLRYVIIQLHRDMNAARSALVWSRSESEARDAEARVYVYMVVNRKARILAGRCDAIRVA